ncbi:hypothetical protein MSG28_002786 [Choristoneura fumiferana]|uniref:Uncharacterized protein n=1 Tax=Choristoneura fumiferana TaxID=7141 RepID=A0ACC0JJ58_CHOFU|nr:hypothetical protein MSG28_002786 [Choristoneura fumiferana]
MLYESSSSSYRRLELESRCLIHTSTRSLASCLVVHLIRSHLADVQFLAAQKPPSYFRSQQKLVVAMKLVISLMLLAFSQARVIETDCDVVSIHNINHEKQVLLKNINGPYQMTIDYDTNTLFFSYTAEGETNDIFKSGYINLKTNEYNTITGIAGGFASAVDKHSQKVYLGGRDDYPNENVYTFKDGVSALLPELQDTKALLIATDGKDNLYFKNSSDLAIQLRFQNNHAWLRLSDLKVLVNYREYLELECALILAYEKIKLTSQPEVSSVLLDMLKEHWIQISQNCVVQSGEEMMKSVVTEKRQYSEVASIDVFAVHNRFELMHTPIRSFRFVTESKSKRGEVTGRSVQIATTILLANPAVTQQCLHCCVSAWRSILGLFVDYQRSVVGVEKISPPTPKEATTQSIHGGPHVGDLTITNDSSTFHKIYTAGNTKIDT